MSSISYVFPGQGSQALGMLADLADNTIVQSTFAQASEVLGYDLWALIQNGPEADLNQTHNTQPAILTASVALYRVLAESNSHEVAYMAGHSLGEYSALVCAGVIDFADAVALVEKRGRYMQEAVPAGTGAMAAVIGLDDAAIVAACEQGAQGSVVSAVNYNSPGQVVIAGEKEAVARAGALCKDAGAKRVLPLPVSVPSHCALMQPAADKLAQDLAAMTFNVPTIKVVNNVDVSEATDEAAIKDALVRQLFSPVRWTESVQYMASKGIDTLVEVGPGKVLTGLARRIDRGLSASAINSQADIDAL